MQAMKRLLLLVSLLGLATARLTGHDHIQVHEGEEINDARNAVQRHVKVQQVHDDGAKEVRGALLRHEKAHQVASPGKMSGDGWTLQDSVKSGLSTPLASKATTLLASLELLAKKVDAEIELESRSRVVQWVLFFAVLLAIFLALFFFGGKMLGSAIEKAIESSDNSILGTEVEIGEIVTHPFSGLVEIKDCTVMNPTKDASGADIEFQSEYVFKAHKIKVDINMKSLLASYGNIVEVECIKVEQLDVIQEKNGYFGGTSNVQVILDHLEGDPPSEKERKKQEAEAAKKTEAEKKEAANNPVEKKSDRQIIIHKLHLTDIGAKMQTKLLGARVAVGDIVKEDFSEEGQAAGVADVIGIVFKSLAKTMVANIAGKGWADKFL